jgi:hypothetical protein
MAFSARVRPITAPPSAPRGDGPSTGAPPRSASAGGHSSAGGRFARAVAHMPAWALTAVCGLAYVLTAPPSADLAAAAYRSELFARSGFTLWDNSWYGGHHLPGYSVLAPALGSWIGVQLLAALSMVAATALFERLIDGLFEASAVRVASLWLAVGASVALLANRVPFDLGLALALACLLTARRSLWPAAVALALLSSLASPVAGAFLALALLAWALAGTARDAVWPLALAGVALLAVALLQIAFPEGGAQPFVASAFWPALAGVLVIAGLLERERRLGGSRWTPARRVLLIGALLYALALALAYALPSAVGGNVDRLGALFAGPAAACALLPARRALLLALAPFLLYWQVNAPVADFAAAVSEPAEHASYYAPLLTELQRLGVGYGRAPARVEVVPTRNHGEARFVAAHVAIARGWERQLDVQRDGLFYGAPRSLSAARYHAWLARQAISYVALPDAALDYSAAFEARLLRGAARPPYLREVWRSAHWRLFAVVGAAPLAQAPATLTSLGTDSFTLRAPSAGDYLVRVRFTPYWALSGSSHGCVARAPGDWTELRARRPGTVHVVVRFSLARVLARGPRCS